MNVLGGLWRPRWRVRRTWWLCVIATRSRDWTLYIMVGICLSYWCRIIIDSRWRCLCFKSRYYVLIRETDGQSPYITGVNRPGVPWDTSWVFQLGCVGNVENMANSRMPVINLWQNEYIHIMLRYYFIWGWCERIIHLFRFLNTYLY